VILCERSDVVVAPHFVASAVLQLIASGAGAETVGGTGNLGAVLVVLGYIVGVGCLFDTVVGQAPVQAMPRTELHGAAKAQVVIGVGGFGVGMKVVVIEGVLQLVLAVAVAGCE